MLIVRAGAVRFSPWSWELPLVYGYCNTARTAKSGPMLSRGALVPSLSKSVWETAAGSRYTLNPLAVGAGSTPDEIGAIETSLNRPTRRIRTKNDVRVCDQGVHYWKNAHPTSK